MGVRLEDRPREKVKEEVIDQLIINYSHGVISEQAFERRLEEAMHADSNERLMSLVADLELGRADDDYQRLKQQKMATPSQLGDAVQKQVTVLSSNQSTGQWRVPGKLRVITVLGSNKLDMSEALFEQDVTVIEINSYLSEETLWLPENARVRLSINNVLSSVENENQDAVSTTGPVIEVKGNLVLGSLKVGVKRTMKEKFMQFANELKSMFADQSGQ